jgi:hypothetical protein
LGGWPSSAHPGCSMRAIDMYYHAFLAVALLLYPSLSISPFLLHHLCSALPGASCLILEQCTQTAHLWSFDNLSLSARVCRRSAEKAVRVPALRPLNKRHTTHTHTRTPTRIYSFSNEYHQLICLPAPYVLVSRFRVLVENEIQLLPQPLTFAQTTLCRLRP